MGSGEKEKVYEGYNPIRCRCRNADTDLDRFFLSFLLDTTGNWDGKGKWKWNPKSSIFHPDQTGPGFFRTPECVYVCECVSVFRVSSIPATPNWVNTLA